MTPIMLGKRIVKQLAELAHTAPQPDTVLENPMNLTVWQYLIPGKILAKLGSDGVKKLRLKSGYEFNIVKVAAHSSTHSKNLSQLTDQTAWFLVYVGENPTTLQYTDPRNNEQKIIKHSKGDTFVLSTTHRFCIDNTDSPTTALYIAVNSGADWNTTAQQYQHKWF